jgi:uncharacterized repeat protein (TIGR01451 family)
VDRMLRTHVPALKRHIEVPRHQADLKRAQCLLLQSLIGLPHLLILITIAFSCNVHAEGIGAGSWVTVAPETAIADGVDHAVIRVYWEDAVGYPVTERARDVEVNALNAGLEVSIGIVTEIGNGFYETTISSSHLGITRLAVILGGTPLESEPVVSFRAQREGYTPELSPSHSANTYHVTAPAVIIDDAITLTGLPAASNVYGATVKITEGWFPGDQLGFVVSGLFSSDYNEDGITGSVTDTGEVILTGTATADDYSKALRSVAFDAQYADPAGITRTIEFSVRLSHPDLEESDYKYDAVTDRYYQYISTPATWEEAKEHADQSSLFGMQGYLVTITSERENDLVHKLAKGREIWLGASQVQERKKWRWVTGPENGVLFYDHPWPTPNQYCNFPNSGPRGDGWRNYMFMQTNGLWFDDHVSTKRAYVIEYGGLEDDPPLVLSATVTMNVAANRPPTAAFETQPEPIRFGEPVSFTDQSHDPEGTDLTYQWSFGDGTPWVNEQHPSHTFAVPGTYIVQLIVTDAGGLSATASDTVVVTADVGGRIYHDMNRNGEWEAGEGGLSGSDYVVRLVGTVSATAPDSEAGHTLDRESGIYYFRSIPAGAYNVIVTTRPDSTVPEAPPGWKYTALTPHIPTSPAIIPGLPILEPGVLQGSDFGFAADGVFITGTVFRDDGEQAGTANDGFRDSDESGLSGLRIRLFSADGRLLGSTLTDAQGQYTLFVSERASDMRIRLILNGSDSLRPTGYTPGSGNSPVVLDAFTEMIDIPLPQGTDTHTGYDFGVVPAMRVAGGGSDIVGSGGVTSYPLSVYAGTHGTLLFDVVSPRSWYYAFYHDRNDNGVYDTGEPPVTDDGIQVSPGNSSFLLTVRAPTYEPEGAVDFAQVNVTFVYQGNPVLSESGTVSVTTTLHSARLQLSTLVRNEMRGEGSFTRTQVEAQPGDYLEYKVEYENAGISPVTDVRISAAIPTGTQLVTDSYGPGKPVEWIDQQGEIRYPEIPVNAGWFFLDLGTVRPGERGSLRYRVILK